MAINASQAEREFYTSQGITGSNVSQMRREFYISQLGAAAGNRPTTQLERDWLQKYGSNSYTGERDLWAEAYNVQQGSYPPRNMHITQIKYEFYIAQAL